MKWIFDKGTLTISGKGKMEGSPWNEKHKGKINKVLIEDGITSISGEAFCCFYTNERSRLASVTIPSSVTQIGKNAFGKCLKLKSITIQNSVKEIGKGAFHSCSALSSVTIPDSVTEIGESAFYDCCGLTSIIIPDSVKKVGAYAFSGWSIKLKSVTISGKDTEIDETAFENKLGTSSTVFTVHPDHYQYMSENGKLKMKPEYKIKYSTHEADGWIYYMDDNRKAIYKARPDASEITLVAQFDFQVSDFEIKDNWIYLYRKWVKTLCSPRDRDGVDIETSIIYEMTLDGKEFTEVSRKEETKH